MPGNQTLNFDDDDGGGSSGGGGGGPVNVLGESIVISVKRGKHTVTQVEGIPSKFCLRKLLKRLKAKDELSCNGHVAKDKESGCEFLVLQGSFSAAVAAFLTREGLADADCIVHRG
jgi:translation initiation factor 1 (eIF-1/SUI1)